MILITISLPRFDLWPKMWFIMENVPRLKKNVFSAVLGWNVLLSIN